MRQLSMWDFIPNDETNETIVKVEILKTVEEWRECTPYAFDAIKQKMESFGVYVTKKIDYEFFNKLMVNVGLPFRSENRGVERDYETVKTFQDGHRLIRFRGRELPVYCLGNKTFYGVAIGEVVA